MENDGIRRHTGRLGIEHAVMLTKREPMHARQAKTDRPPCCDQTWCQPDQQQKCAWKHQCIAKLAPLHGLVLSGNALIGYQIATLLSSTYGWKMQVVHADKPAYDLILQGNIDAVVADIDKVDLGGLAMLAHTKHHWPSIRTYAITGNEDFYIKRLARDMGGCEGFFYRRNERELDTQMGLGAQLMMMTSKNNTPHILDVADTE